jgi:hypothetical protein
MRVIISSVASAAAGDLVGVAGVKNREAAHNAPAKSI